MSKGADVLIIDDDAWLREQFARTLTKAGHTVRLARQGVEGMEMIDDKAPNVIVLDIFMPGPNGIVLLHELQSHSDLATIPVILCTNSASEVPLKTVAPYGVIRVLDKTVMEPRDITAAVEHAR